MFIVFCKLIDDLRLPETFVLLCTQCHVTSRNRPNARYSRFFICHNPTRGSSSVNTECYLYSLTSFMLSSDHHFVRDLVFSIYVQVLISIIYLEKKIFGPCTNDIQLFLCTLSQLCVSSRLQIFVGKN